MLIKKQKLNILMTAAEAAPYAKVGGLADVVNSLPPALKKLGHDVRIIMPKYGKLIDEKKYKLKKVFANIEIPTSGSSENIDIWEGILPGKKVKVYFIYSEKYFSEDYVYSMNDKLDSERFLFFSLAVLHVLPFLKFKPNVIHCHDFQTALITDLIKVNRLYSGYLKHTRTIYTIHNLNYQGKSEIGVLSTGNLKKRSLKTLSKDSQDGDINFMAQGILNADAVNTVSPSYAKEIGTSMYGAGLERVVMDNMKKITGILNGIDVDHFNPENDKHITQNFSLRTIKRKEENKLALQKKLGLSVDVKIPLIGFVSRLAWQKGIDLFRDDRIEELISSKTPCQFVFLGTGHKPYEEHLRKLDKKFRHNISANIMFDIGFAQQIYAGSDIFMIPSRFEPCGLGQMIAMRYGTVPIARATGGLRDTVDAKVGFKFEKFSSREMFETIKKAVGVYYKSPKKWMQLKKNCMKRDFSWDKSAKEYIKLYKKVLKNN